MRRTRIFKGSTYFTDPVSFPLAVLRIPQHDDMDDLHKHDFHELVVILAGEGRHLTDTGNYAVKGGDVFLVQGEAAHGYTEVDSLSLVNILFDPKQLGLRMRDLRNLSGYHALFRVEPKLRAADRFQSRLQLDIDELAEAARLIACIETELDSHQAGYRFHACTYLMQLLGYLSRCYSKSEFSTERPLMQLGDLLSYLEQHCAEPMTIEMMAKRARMSESTLMRTFRKVMGHSPMDYVIRLRLKNAATLLQHTTTGITEVAFQCGFNDSNYFSRQFRNSMGLSPREYRNQKQK